MTPNAITIRQLEQLAGVQARTLRHWIRKKLIPKPLGRGRGARYTQEHVLRASVIRQLRSQGASLRGIHAQLCQMSEEQMLALKPQLAPSATESVPAQAPALPHAPPPAPSYPFQTWDVVTLFDGVVLLVNSSRPASRRIADEIYRYYGAATQAP